MVNSNRAVARCNHITSFRLSPVWYPNCTASVRGLCDSHKVWQSLLWTGQRSVRMQIHVALRMCTFDSEHSLQGLVSSDPNKSLDFCHGSKAHISKSYALQFLERYLLLHLVSDLQSYLLLVTVCLVHCVFEMLQLILGTCVPVLTHTLFLCAVLHGVQLGSRSRLQQRLWSDHRARTQRVGSLAPSQTSWTVCSTTLCTCLLGMSRAFSL